MIDDRSHVELGALLNAEFSSSIPKIACIRHSSLAVYQLDFHIPIFDVQSTRYKKSVPQLSAVLVSKTKLL
jgi:hypothetical protein